MFWDSFDRKICLTLKHTRDRRKEAERECKKVGLSDVEFFYGVTPKDEAVKDAYRQKKVVEYPSCWRCGQDRCECSNNILIPSQVACFISYLNIFEMAVESDDYTFMVFEDDIEFETYFKDVAARTLTKQKLEPMHFYSEFPCLLSLGQGYYGKGHIGTRAFRDNIRWADGDLSECNVMFAFNKPFAKLALRFMRKFTMTSDIYIHNFLGTRSIHWSLFPRIAHDKSWSTGTVKSEIHPKQLYVDNVQLSLKERLDEKRRLLKHVKRVSTREEYDKYIEEYLKDS